MGTRRYGCVWQFFTTFAAVCGQADVELSEMSAVMADADGKIVGVQCAGCGSQSDVAEMHDY